MGHPPAPGPFVRPDVSAIENAVRDITFPISKREMIERINEEDTVVLNGRNVDLRGLVRDLNDDVFESEDEFREALETTYGVAAERIEAWSLPAPGAGSSEERPDRARGAGGQPALRDGHA